MPESAVWFLTVVPRATHVHLHFRGHVRTRAKACVSV